MRDSTEVLIVGAGPVGLLLATELARDGVDVVLIDRLRERSFFCKALGVTPRTLEIFDDIGIVHEAIDRGVWLRGLSSFIDGAPGPGIEMPESLPFGSLSLAQFETERLLESALRRHGGSVSYGWELRAMEVGASGGVRAQLAGPGGENRAIECRWLAGCDGAHSAVRAALGMDFAGARFAQTFALADLEVEWALPRGRGYRFIHGAPGQPGSRSLVAIPVRDRSGRRYRLSTVLADAHDDAAGDTAAAVATAPTLEQIATVMSPLLPPGARLSSLHWSSVYSVSHRIVAAYSQGPVFLAGDAAHLHPPVGGQGMNTGLQDAHNLAWKLALASCNIATPALLASYSAERRPVGVDVVESTSRALNEVLNQRVQSPGMRETQLLVGYRGSALVRDERADAANAALAAGDRAPNAGGLRRAFVGDAFRLHERLGRGRHVLIGCVDATPAASELLASMARLLHDTLGDAGATLAIAADGAEPAEREDLSLAVDAGEEFAAAYQARPGMAWLVRPDGHIGWCSAAPSLAGLSSFLGAFVRVPASAGA